ncbi:universal stress protein [Halobacteriales archaeon SW_6_65_15]|jgi:nucleotide-binding universal stress UspA family protein|nr:MAG: universal stress protein [Halobacteriales archaeon SW_6_65_15]
MFDRILVPTDGTPSSDCAVENSLELAARHDAEIHALYVVETDSAMGHYDLAVEREEEQGEAAVEAVERRATESGHDLTVTKAFRYGNPPEEILDYAADHDVDLIMMGTHGRSGFDRLLNAGSVAERVVREADVPVMVAGPEACRLPE